MVHVQCSAVYNNRFNTFILKHKEFVEAVKRLHEEKNPSIRVSLPSPLPPSCPSPPPQGPPKYPTNAPPNLPIPPLLPGEEVLLQQHRVACVDCFPEPAVGSVYITNFRVIFNGNSISVRGARETSTVLLFTLLFNGPKIFKLANSTNSVYEELKFCVLFEPQIECCEELQRRLDTERDGY